MLGLTDVRVFLCFYVKYINANVYFWGQLSSNFQVIQVCVRVLIGSAFKILGLKWVILEKKRVYYTILPYLQRILNFLNLSENLKLSHIYKNTYEWKSKMTTTDKEEQS